MKRPHGDLGKRGDMPGKDDSFDAAAAWHARWRDAPDSGLTAQEVDQWAEWSKVPENKAAYDAVEFVSRARFMLQPPPLPTPEELAADDTDAPVFVPRPILNNNHGTGMRWGGLALFALAATAAAVAFTPALRWLGFNKPEPVHLVSTTAGELKQITLSDGSRVTLGAKTELSVNYGQCQRTILLEAGEALFTVAHDPKCPFIVIAGDGAITAVGTEFSVRRTLDRVTVQVSEGSVNVQPRVTLAAVSFPKETELPSVSWPDAKLAQGQEVTYHGSESRTPVESEDTRVATEWLDGRREYHHEPLRYLIADISRYVDEPIELDPEIGDLEFSGLVYESQVKKTLQDLEIIFKVKVTRTEQNHILIQPRDATDERKIPTP